MTLELEDFSCSAINKIVKESLTTAYKKGVEESHSIGISKPSYEKGKREGFVQGHDVGYDRGYAQGHDVGFEKGHDVGYDRGYEQAEKERGEPFAFHINGQNFEGLKNKDTDMCYMKKETIKGLVEAAKRFSKSKHLAAFEQMRDEHTLMCEIVTQFQTQVEQLKKEKAALKRKHAEDMKEISDRVKQVKRQFEDVQSERPDRSNRRRFT